MKTHEFSNVIKIFGISVNFELENSRGEKLYRKSGKKEKKCEKTMKEVEF